MKNQEEKRCRSRLWSTCNTRSTPHRHQRWDISQPAAPQSIDSTLPVGLVTDTTPQHTCAGLWFHTKVTFLPLFCLPAFNLWDCLKYSNASLLFLHFIFIHCQKLSPNRAISHELILTTLQRTKAVWISMPYMGWEHSSSDDIRTSTGPPQW